MLQTHLIAELLGKEAFDFEKIEQSEKKPGILKRQSKRNDLLPRRHRITNREASLGIDSLCKFRVFQ